MPGNGATTDRRQALVISRIAGLITLVGGVLLGGEFLRSLPDTLKALQDAAAVGHLSLGFLAFLYGGGRTISGSVVGALVAVALATIGIQCCGGVS
jgi:hypothetical protein